MVRELLQKLLEERLSDSGRAFWDKARAELGEGASGQAFAKLLALASRHARRQPIELTASELAAAEGALPGWSPRAWNRLELLRVNLILARPDLEEDRFAEDFESLFRFADEGETCALYRSLPLLPKGERFVWRAAEACRTNMLTVFEAVALDSPFPVNHFDDTAWHQLVIKALFLDLPLYRIAGLDSRMTPELTRMALDWAAERASAGRPFHMGLWLCLGPHEDQRIEDLIVSHWPSAEPSERWAMGLALARAERTDCLLEQLRREEDHAVREQLQRALDGAYDQEQFAPLFSDGHN
ncbi:EboA domain-containing protein [Marinimicrobium sp. ABcell2]|uniref:EboA domain-containing protein n=1 Tax=Marinimicrobium sp. ABcell2 TaxID=3069751 RepID=UPI0027B0AA64|nr:EboA domain-containing protein [Marinimicrobium sp. ABcell2]MDQ2075259.1 EboA domain-containing protein [Marinimicrobium sp. ABcell2]